MSRRVKAGSITNHFGKTLHSNPSFFSSFLGCWYCRFRGVCACECVCVRGWRFWSESTTCTDVQTNASGETDRETARPKAFSNLSHDVHKASKYKLFVLLISLFFYNPMSMKHILVQVMVLYLHSLKIVWWMMLSVWVLLINLDLVLLLLLLPF